MQQKKTVKIELYFTKDGMDDKAAADVKTDGVPVSLIIESLNNLTSGMAKQLVKEAQRDGIVSKKDQEDYLQGMINLDREKLKLMFK